MPSKEMARWSPERFHLAMSRLLALLWVRWNRARQHEPAGRLASFSFDREQMAVEAYLTSVAWVAFMAAAMASFTSEILTPLPAVLNFILQIFVLVVLTPLLMAVVSIVLRLARFKAREPGSISRIQSFVFLVVSVLTAVALVLEDVNSVLGITWLALTMLNLAAAIILLMFRGRVRALEKSLRQCLPDD